MVLEKREMLYEMKRIERAHPGSIMPPEGLGRGRKWTVLVEAHENCETEYDWTIKAEINFVHPEFIRVLCRSDACGAAFHFLEAMYLSFAGMLSLPTAAPPPSRCRCALVPIEKLVPQLVYLTHEHACGRAPMQCTGSAG